MYCITLSENTVKKKTRPDIFHDISGEHLGNDVARIDELTRALALEEHVTLHEQV